MMPIAAMMRCCCIAIVGAAQIVAVSGTTADVRLTPRVLDGFVAQNSPTTVAAAENPACEPYSILRSRKGSIEFRTRMDADSARGNTTECIFEVNPADFNEEEEWQNVVDGAVDGVAILRTRGGGAVDAPGARA